MPQTWLQKLLNIPPSPMTVNSDTIAAGGQPTTKELEAELAHRIGPGPAQVVNELIDAKLRELK